ncbi:ABC transporter ATP-binding protein [Ferrovibrio sp.]|uniref:ABC transporter ATP-binding protein n=1 Tax=Ferrovibrio sp. TaxID=1917215 RepID=UPI001B74F89D|nr:ABC transporter ATP-binding protein [Ferrovibrio sp.]MBP7063842.1 ABC transporter ATP-binding protein [Ferrovibrio sp.]
MLRLENLSAWYGPSHILQGVSLEVGKGEIVTLIGRNGAGKTTTLRTIMGLVPKRQGVVQFDGAEILQQPAHTRFHRGLAYVPEERRIVPGLTVEENLRLGIIAAANRADERRMIDFIAETFPRLKQRLGQEAITMSGGEQQMLAIARAMMAKPKMILLDEPSEGIMPILVDEMFELFRRMKAEGTTILLVEQNVELALGLSDRAYIMDQGVIVHHDSAANLLADKAMQERYCAV